MSDISSVLTLTGWRREVAELYARIRETPRAEWDAAWREFRDARDRLFADHPQSPLEPADRDRFDGLTYYPYDPAYRVTGRVDRDVEPETFAVELRDDGRFCYRRVGWVRFDLDGRTFDLAVYWVEGYGGGLFLPFRDATNGGVTYGGGRYLYDTIKGADLGAGPDELPLDFNFAYNPSCVYSDRWHCPLPPAENELGVRVEAGERADVSFSDPATGGSEPTAE